LEGLARQRDLELAGREQPNKAGPAKSRSDRKGMNSKLFELGAAKARVAALRQGEEAKRGSGADDPTLKQPKEISNKDQDQGEGKAR
jgi:hypothetical protein